MPPYHQFYDDPFYYDGSNQPPPLPYAQQQPPQHSLYPQAVSYVQQPQYLQYPQHPSLPQRQPQVVIPPYQPQQFSGPSYSQTMGYPPLQQFPAPPGILQDVQAPNVPRQQIVVKPAPLSEPVAELDYPVLLLSLSDEYLEVAHRHAERSEEYCKLVATALGCLESVLNNFKLPPLKEAQLSLRYVEVLVDETENNDDAEKILTKAVDLCEKNKFIDLKYTLQAKMARVLHRSRPKAAIRNIEAIIEDADAYKHVAWEYHFRFLHASFSLSSNTAHDVHNAIQQLDRIGTVARQAGDHAIFAFAAILQSLAHLQTSSAESATLAQRALASARQLQLNPDVAASPQLQILMDFIDLSCSLKESNTKEAEEKIKTTQKTLDQALELSGWHEDGSFLLPVSKRSLNGVSPQTGGAIIEKNNKYFLAFSWLPETDVEVLGYSLSAASVAHKNASDGGKAEKYLQAGLDLLRTNVAGDQERPRSLVSCEQRTVQQKTLEFHFLVEKGFLLSAKGSWDAARAALDEAHAVLRTLGKMAPSEMQITAKYLDGVIYQGTGDLRKALTIYQSALFALPQSNLPASSSQTHPKPTTKTKASTTTQHHLNLSVLAALNTILIIHSPSHPQHHLLNSLLTTLAPLISLPTTPKPLISAFSLLSTLPPGTSMLSTKHHLGTSLSIAQSIQSAQLTALTLIIMADRFFTGVVGEQAMKCAKAASHQARRAGDPLWMSVAGGMEARYLDLEGKEQEARRVKADAEEVVKRLPTMVSQRAQSVVVPPTNTAGE